MYTKCYIHMHGEFGSVDLPEATLNDCIDYIRYCDLRNCAVIDAVTGEVMYMVGNNLYEVD